MNIEVLDTPDGGHRYEVGGEIVPGVSEILEANDVLLKNAFFEERAEYAAIRGRDVHLACADLDHGFPNWWEGEEIEPYVNAYIQFKKDFEFEPTIIEAPCYHPEYRYAGTPDRFGSLRLTKERIDVTLDLKATVKVGPHVALQTAAYNQFAPDPEHRSLCALQLKPTGRYQVHWWDDRDHQTAVFFAMLTVYFWKQRHHHQ